MSTKGNLISIAFTEEELRELDEAISKIETVLKGKMHNLTQDERKQFGRIAEQNKLFVDKSKTFMEEYPQYVPTFLDKEEFDRDYQARKIIEKRLLRLESITEQFVDTKVLLDNDNYTNALTFYRNIRFLSQEDMPGTTSIASELKQFFPRTGNTKE